MSSAVAFPFKTYNNNENIKIRLIKMNIFLVNTKNNNQIEEYELRPQNNIKWKRK